MLKTMVLKLFYYTQILVRWSHRALPVIHTLPGGIYRAGPHAEIRCGDLEIQSAHHYPAEVMIPHRDPKKLNFVEHYMQALMSMSNVNQNFLAWLKQPKLLRSPRERSIEKFRK